MNKVLVTALAFAAVATVASAQQADQVAPEKRFTIDASTVKPGPAIAPGADQMVLPADTTIGYIWNSKILRRIDNDPSSERRGYDSNRVDPLIPRRFSQQPGQPLVEFRGVGQIFSPGILYQTYYPSTYNATSEIIYVAPGDSEYISQFNGAKEFTIDTIGFFVYPNTRDQALILAGGKLKVWRTNYNVGSTQYKSAGIKWAMDDQRLMGFGEQGEPFELAITPEMLLERITKNPDNPDEFTITRTEVVFDPPLEFGAGESAVVLYYNDEAEAITDASQQQDAEWQQVITALEYRRGDFNDHSNWLRSPLDGTNSSKTFGLTMFRYPEGGGEGTKDTIYTAFNSLVYTNPNNPAARLDAKMNMNMYFAGSVHLLSGVKWHYGQDANNQGLGSVVPNPVGARAMVPFSLVERSNVAISLFDMNGREVQSLVNETLVPGKYSYEIDAANLLNGVYVVRMVAGDNVYTTKINVSK